MKTREEILSKLDAHRSSSPSKWREKAEWRNVNNTWLRYSQRIAIMMLDKMEELGLTQKSVAERMGCSQQYISRVLKGTENLSIETISKIEQALELEILEPVIVSH
ncbi:MAG: helix-turn-helix transcriptional regulator [Muribaculaceae bacterium]|nr:helix-turn-helix transcriptional regulator [Muribaculaceae bacterium]MDE6322428.1 helix-turn-helix transcriptional regulator [Muribaculaceae bacterium]